MREILSLTMHNQRNGRGNSKPIARLREARARAMSASNSAVPFHQIAKRGCADDAASHLDSI
jgi:hypothetical protein